MIAGSILYLIHNGHNMPEDHIFRGEPANLRQIPRVLNEVLALHGRGIIQFGLLLLILTPLHELRFQYLHFGNSAINSTSLSR